MPRKARTTDGDGLSACGCEAAGGCGSHRQPAKRQVQCELCGESFTPRSDDDEGSSLCPECRRAYVRICPYCERPYRTDRWPQDLCPECYEDQDWRRDDAGDGYEDEFDRLDAY
ncbi:hypothetical protein [Methanofollis sp.]|uniref:hypothetical protein n=1 Tax=Methanofollis sp. TaxID=2052835 RepID=UPI00260DDF1D|nr:hypothetical protein [Methanofollis sp.]